MVKDKTFNDIYDKTYDMLLRYIICNINNLDDVNDIIQEVYFELCKRIKKEDINSINNIDSYVIGIAKNRIKKYYSKLYNLKNIFKFDIEKINNIKNNINIEKEVINYSIYNEIWKYIKTKDITIQKIFLLYYKYDYKIKDISNILNITESKTKNDLYRTLNEIKKIFGRINL